MQLCQGLQNNYFRWNIFLGSKYGLETNSCHQHLWPLVAVVVAMELTSYFTDRSGTPLIVNQWRSGGILATQAEGSESESDPGHCVQLPWASCPPLLCSILKSLHSDRDLLRPLATMQHIYTIIFHKDWRYRSSSVEIVKLESDFVGRRCSMQLLVVSPLSEGCSMQMSVVVDRRLQTDVVVVAAVGRSSLQRLSGCIRFGSDAAFASRDRRTSKRNQFRFVCSKNPK